MRIASFNLENFTDVKGSGAPLTARINSLRPQIQRMNADILCLQEVDASKNATGVRELAALSNLVKGTHYEKFHVSHTCFPGTNYPVDRHNLIVLSRWPFSNIAQYSNDFVAAPLLTSPTRKPRQSDPEPLVWDRPILHVEIELPPRQEHMRLICM